MRVHTKTSFRFGKWLKACSNGLSMKKRSKTLQKWLQQFRSLCSDFHEETKTTLHDWKQDLGQKGRKALRVSWEFIIPKRTAWRAA